jgi:hypothetical protein
MPAHTHYTRLLLEGDPRGRCAKYVSGLERTFTELHEAGVLNVIDFWARVETREQMGAFTALSRVRAQDFG